MSGFSFLDVAIGMTFIYLLLSLICSAVNELISATIQARAHFLENGIARLLENPEMLQQLYDHPLVRNLYGESKPMLARFGRKDLPSYIPARNFALALMDLAKPGGAGVRNALAKPDTTTTQPPAAPPPSIAPPAMAVAAAAGQSAAAPGAGAAIPAAAATTTPPPAAPASSTNAPPAPSPSATQGTAADLLDALKQGCALPPTVKQALVSIVEASGQDAVKARQNIEDWYNSTMERVSGAYKRRTQFAVFAIGVAATVAVNADSVAIAKRLSASKTLSSAVADTATRFAQATPPTPLSTSQAQPANPPAAQPVMPPAASTPAQAENPTATQDPTGQLTKTLATLDNLGLPMGWRGPDPDNTLPPWPGFSQWFTLIGRHWPGWLLTALAVSFGAPFWFDLLNRFITVRSTVKPKEGAEGASS